MMPTEGAFYGNRAAGWIMLKEFKKAVDDCVTGLKLEKTFGELDKLRQVCVYTFICIYMYIYICVYL
jgi:hypothetical protein